MTLNEQSLILPMEPLTKDCAFTFSLTERACKRIQTLVEKEKKADRTAQPYLQIHVDGGGCSGFQYLINLVTISTPDDIYFQAQGIQVGLDVTSLELLDKSVLDYEEDMMSASFVIKNPNAKSSCGCGNSFSIM